MPAITKKGASAPGRTLKLKKQPRKFSGGKQG